MCLVTQAIHLELLSNVSSEALIAAFTRFIARKHMPNEMMSHNGTNFKTAISTLFVHYKRCSILKM